MTGTAGEGVVANDRARDRIRGRRRSGAPSRRRPAAGLAILIALACGAAALVVGASVALARSRSRQSATLAFTTKRPNRSTGVRLAIDYVNPDDRTAKPPAVATVVTLLARGARIDTSVPARCRASDAELTARGPAACPAASRVGEGEVDLDTGAPGPLRIVKTHVTFLNNKAELIYFFEATSTPLPVRSVLRAPIKGGKITTQAPPIPGAPPPDAFTAVKRVRIELDAVTRASATGTRSYITTPPSCPRSRRWVNVASFTYRDAVTQTVRSGSP